MPYSSELVQQPGMGVKNDESNLNANGWIPDSKKPDG